ncbi:MAG: type II toxin-antitoxin system PemK/MazF family toxin [Planctomycetota bacterium]
MTANPLRGEVWLIDFSPRTGDEIDKLRRAVVVNDDAVGKLRLRVVVPLTGWQEKFRLSPWMVPLPPSKASGITKPVAADAFQVKSLSLKRFRRRLGALGVADMEEVSAGLAICLGIE